MQSEDQGYGGQNDPDPAQKPGAPAKPIKATIGRGPGERTDGITKLKGDVTFAANGVVSISVDITEGSANGTSGYQATGWANVQPLPNPTEHPATRSGVKITASGLPKATAGVEYVVRVGYVIHGTRKHLQGSVAASHVSLPHTAHNVTLNP